MRSSFEVADVVRRHRSAYENRYPIAKTPTQARALDAIENCRTSILGGHVTECGKCGHRHNAYNSCRNRHCPKCQTSARERWLEARQSELLPVAYYHAVFTIPEVMADIALQNKSVVYSILFRAASEALLKVGARARHLGAQMGFLAVLHTWGQNLQHHPHVHCVIPAGGLDGNGAWRASRSERFLLPVRVLSRLFRGRFLSLIRAEHLKGTLEFHGKLKDYRHFEAFCLALREAKRHEWVVYCKRPFGGPEQVLGYLGRYTHRVAISNQRLLDVGDTVQFQWKDYRNGQHDSKLELTGVEFLRRLMLHALPRGFVRIRHYGFLSNRHRASNLEKCRVSLATSPGPQPIPSYTSTEEAVVRRACPHCHGVHEHWSVVGLLYPPRPAKVWNSS